jgi:carboxypeptidase C (cathepsin A)
MVGKRRLDYSVTCGTVVLREDEQRDGQRSADKPRASLFFVAYTLKGAKPETRRSPSASTAGRARAASGCTWASSGRSGSSPTRWATRPPPPYALTDNEHTLLTDSDLVFIDPVGHRPFAHGRGREGAEFHEYQRDLDAVGEFIRLYLTRFGRWAARST